MKVILSGRRVRAQERRPGDERGSVALVELLNHSDFSLLLFSFQICDICFIGFL